VFTAMTLEEPLMALDYSSPEDLANATSFTGAAMAAGEYAASGDGGGGLFPGAAPAGGPPAAAAAAQRGKADRDAAARAGGGGGAVQQRVVEQKLGRNDPCWCGSGKKFKKCHGA